MVYLSEPSFFISQFLMQYTHTLSAIAREAGEAILSIYHHPNFAETVEWKADNSPLTLADKAANEVICKALEAHYPDIPILSEEGKMVSYEVRKKWQRFWLIDPLDGTKEFIKKNGEFTVNIALIENGEPTVGVVFVPVKDQLFFAEKGKGAFKTDEKGITSRLQGCTENLETRPIHIVSSRSHLSPETAAFIAQFPQAKCVSMGSSLKFMLIAEGSADIYPRFAPTMEWDIAASHIIVTESGAILTDYPDKKQLLYNKENLLNPHFWVVGQRAIL